jgi:flagellar basal body-associated protein FliL
MYQKRTIGALAVLCTFALISATSAAYASEDSSAAKPEVGDVLYVDFKNIVVPVIKKNGQTGVVALTLTAQVKDIDDQSKVVDKLPKLRDAFIRTLYGNLDTGNLMLDNGSLDIPQIKYRLMKTADLVMDGKRKNPIKDILFQNISQQVY